MNYPRAFVPSLIVQHTGQQYPLGQTDVTIGRAADNRIILSDPNVSAHHALLSWQAGTYVLQDLGSGDGTYVNEWRITTPQPLYDGDIIRIGDTNFDVRLAPSTGAAAPPPTVAAYPGARAEPGRPMPTAVYGSSAAPATRGSYARSYSAPAAAAAPSRRSSMPLIVGLLLLFLVLAAIVIGGLYMALGGGRSRPVVTIQSPQDNTQVLAGQEVLVQATATGARDITRMELHIDDTLVGTATSPDPAGQPSLTATQPWTFQQPGPHTISVVAFTAQGQTGTSEEVNVTVVSSVADITPTVPPTATPTETPTATPTMTNTVAPTDTAEPSATPTPPVPVVEFWADETTLERGQSTLLHWHVENVLQIFLDGQPVTGPDGQVQVTPQQTTTYELRAVHTEGVETQEVTITVVQPADQTATLTSQPGLDGFVANPGGPATNLDISVGDGEISGTPPVELVARGFMSFDLSGIPANATIKSVELRFYQVVFDGDPYAKLGTLVLQHMDYGDSLDGTDFQLAELDSLNLTPQTAPGSWYAVSTADLVSWVADDLNAGRSRTQFRLRFTTDADGDGVVDMVRIESGNNDRGTGNVPQLVIVYTP
jgi:hypothetical protein